MEKRTRFQKIHLCVLAAMILIFGAITVFNQYHRGFRFQNGLLKPSRQSAEILHDVCEIESPW